MTIIELAQQAGFKRYQEQAPGIDGVVANWIDIEAFANLVAAHEREECAKLCETAEIPIDIGIWKGTKKSLSAATAMGLANAIRARGTT